MSEEKKVSSFFFSSSASSFDLFLFLKLNPPQLRTHQRDKVVGGNGGGGIRLIFAILTPKYVYFGDVSGLAVMDRMWETKSAVRDPSGGTLFRGGVKNGAIYLRLKTKSVITS